MGFAAIESARKQLDNLVTEGRLEKQPGIARGYRLPKQRNDLRAARVPLLGTVQAGKLQEAIENPDGWILVESRRRTDDLFALRVCGDSMIDAAILEGDIVIVRRGPVQESGAIVVALVGDDATVKTLRLRRSRVVLEPANPAYEPFTPDPDNLQILGRVIEIRRTLT